MDIPPPTPSIESVQPMPPVEVLSPHKPNIMGIFAAILLVLAGIGAVYILKSKSAAQNQAAVTAETTPAETPIATPTPLRTSSTIATQPAFLQFQSAVATLSGAITSFNPNDSSLTPPTLILPLGFGQQ